MKIYYNISYSYDYVICIISNKEIGIDIEKIRKTNINTKKIFATKIEQNYSSRANNMAQLESRNKTKKIAMKSKLRLYKFNRPISKNQCSKFFLVFI